MFTIAICDDEIKICSQIEKIILNFNKKISQIISVEMYTSGEELYKYLKNGTRYDLLLLDIELQLLSGVEIGYKIRNEMRDDITQIVYISSKDSYAMDLFEVRPLNFLIKPITEEKIVYVIEKAMELSNKLNKFFSYKKNHNYCKRPIKDILYFESIDRQIKMVTIDEVIIFYGSLEKIFLEIEKYLFIYIHKSYVVNYFHVIEFRYQELKMSNKDILPISQSKRKSVRQLQLKLEKEEI